jgi:hypothetical protein
MNVTPNTLVSQVAAARAARVVPFGGDRLAFTSQTGVVRPERDPQTGWTGIVEDDAHCFVCSRHTDHFAEHDDLVEQGFARYEDDGSVTWTEKGWNEFRA